MKGEGMYMKRSIAGHLYSTETARPIESIRGEHEIITLYQTKVKRRFLHITADTHSIFAGYDKKKDCVMPREDLLPVSEEEGHQIISAFKQRKRSITS